jgi:hypothetical protein
MIQKLREYYIPKRYKEVDADFLEFEEEMIAKKDLVKILNLLREEELRKDNQE